MDTIPAEMLERILLCLSPKERLRCALACRRWAKLVSDSHMLKDVRLVLRGTYQREGRYSPGMIQRRYWNVRIDKGYNTHPLREIGADLRNLQVTHWSTRGEEFHEVLLLCPNLECLDISPSSVLDDRRHTLLETPTVGNFDEIRQAMQNLRRLSLPWPGYTLFDHFLSIMPNLSSLKVDGQRSNHKFSGPNVSPKLRSLNHSFVKLDFSNTNIEDLLMVHLLNANLGTLQVVRLEYCSKLTRRSWTAIGNCTKLRFLSVTRARDFDDGSLKKIFSSVSNLEHLNLGQILSITANALKHIGELRKLRRLIMPDVQTVNDEVWISLGRVWTLQYLDLGSTPSNIMFFRLSEDLEDMRVLKLRNGAINDEAFSLLCDNFKKLTRLETGPLLEPMDVDGVKFCQLKKLRHLTIRGASNFADAILRNGVGSPAMETLILDFINITNDTLANIAVSHGRLRTLSLSGCKRITDLGLGTLLDGEPHLENLCLLQCTLLSNGTLRLLVGACPRLRHLRVSGCEITGAGLNQFRAQRRLVCVHFASRAFSAYSGFANDVYHLQRAMMNDALDPV